jgi:ERCC4-type nuclease
MEKCPFAIAVDTREQQPFSFEGITVGKNKTPIVIPTQVATLKQGDYSIVGFENRVAIERKSIPDLCSTIFHGRDRFIRELERMDKMDFAAIIIEGDWADCQHYCALMTNANPVSLDGSVIAFQIRHKAQWLFRPGRYVAMKTTFKLLHRWWTDEEARNKNVRKQH